MSRVDYTPIDIGGIIDPTKPKISTYVNEIKDFSSGIMYRVWADYGNCSISWVGQDPHGDVTVNDDGSITMTSPLEMFGLQYKFAKNGRGVNIFSLYLQNFKNSLTHLLLVKFLPFLKIDIWSLLLSLFSNKTGILLSKHEGGRAQTSR